MNRIFALLFAVAPGLAFAQDAAPPAETPPPAPQAVEDHDEEEENKGGWAIEAMFGPKSFSNDVLPNGSGTAMLISLRSFDHDGFFRSDFGLFFHRDSGTTEDGPVKAKVSSLGGGLDLSIGFGIGPVEILGGGGFGVNWANSEVATPLGTLTEDVNNPAVVGNYGASASVLLGPLRPIFRIRRDVDWSTDGDVSDGSGITGTSFLFGLGLEFGQL